MGSFTEKRFETLLTRRRRDLAKVVEEIQEKDDFVLIGSPGRQRSDHREAIAVRVHIASSCANASGRTLIATSRFSFVSDAR